MNKSDSVVIIPTYNEKENIENIINAVFALPVMFDVLIIDDNSPDGTAAIVERMQKQWDGRLHLLKRSGKLGLGTAYIMGFKWCLNAGYEFIIEMDADFSHPPKKLLELRLGCQRGKLAYGTRHYVVLRFGIRQNRDGYERARHDGWLCVLPPQRARGYRPRQNPLQGLRVPD